MLIDLESMRGPDSETDEMIIDLMRKLVDACSHAEELIVCIQKHLDESSSPCERYEFVRAVREIRSERGHALLAMERVNQLSGAQDKERWAEEALFIRKAILAIRLQVSRLAGMLETLLPSAAGV
jgi:hypothetical protein